MEVLALNKEHLDTFAEIKGRYEKGDHKAFLMFAEEKKKNPDLDVKNGVAKIKITGILGNGWYYDTEYNSIIQQTIEAESRNDVESIDYIVDSPGGLVSGAEEAARAIKNTKKPTRAIVKNLAASAAYWLASQTNKIVVMNESAMVGSIGVMAVFYDFSKWEADNGIEKIKIISSKAPDKNPDAKTEKGFKKYQTEIDKLHDIFVKNVANGRNTTSESVNENFGQGGTLFADEAKNAGMIDKVSLDIEDLINNNDTEEHEMAKDDKVFSQAEVDELVKVAKSEAKAEGLAEGVKEERARVEKHLNYVGAAKNETVVANIKSGADFSACVEKYAEEKFATKEINSRKTDNPVPDEETGSRGSEGKEQSVFTAHESIFGK